MNAVNAATSVVARTLHGAVVIATVGTVLAVTERVLPEKTVFSKGVKVIATATATGYALHHVQRGVVKVTRAALKMGGSA